MESPLLLFLGILLVIFIIYIVSKNKNNTAENILINKPMQVKQSSEIDTPVTGPVPAHESAHGPASEPEIIKSADTSVYEFVPGQKIDNPNHHSAPTRKIISKHESNFIARKNSTRNYYDIPTPKYGKNYQDIPNPTYY
jgi:hypothetical protein